MRDSSLTLALAAALGCAGCAHTGVGVVSGLEKLDFREVINDAKDKVFPAVVYIKVVKRSHEQGRRTSEEVSGSGVIISAAGEVLSNWHVVEKAVEVRCLLYDGRPLAAEVVGTDKDTDLALLRLKLPPDAKPLPYASLGDSKKLKEGDHVMAMGAPWGMARSVSIGIVSCTRRFLPEVSQYSLWLQTDASISPGNSGGPLVNTDGEVIGINTRAVFMGGDMGFAVPSETIRNIVAKLRRGGRVDRSWTGLVLQPVKDFDKNIYFSGTRGVIVSGVEVDSPAEAAGLQAQDRILKLEGAALDALMHEDLPAVRRRLGMLSRDRPVRIDLLREGKPMAVRLVPREKGRVEGEELDCPRWDFTVKSINQFDTPELYFYRRQGVFVFGIKSPGNAVQSGLGQRDILLKVEGREVKTLADVSEIHRQTVARVKHRPRLVLTVLRNGLLRQVVLDIQRDYEKE